MAAIVILAVLLLSLSTLSVDGTTGEPLPVSTAPPNLSWSHTEPSTILMVTMGGTRSHKVPFQALDTYRPGINYKLEQSYFVTNHTYGTVARAMVQRGHNVTLLTAFPEGRDAEEEPGLEEVTPMGLVAYVRNYTNWDLVGARIRGEEPVPWSRVLAYTYESCDALLSDPETKELISGKGIHRRKYGLVILDGAFPECGLALVHKLSAPFMYINTVGFHTAGMATSGSPTSPNITPFPNLPFTDRMNIVERTINLGFHVLFRFLNDWVMTPLVQRTVARHISGVPPLQQLAKNVSFILQNGHFSVSYPRAYMPNVAEIACIHCHEARPLPRYLDDFVRGGRGTGFVFVSMGSSVRAANMPELLRLQLIRAFAQLPYQVLWKWEEPEGANQPALPPNVRLERWLPQQDLLGHPMLRAFVTHGGLLSMFEIVYHGVPVVTLPVFCDHDANAAKAAADGYAIALELRTLTGDQLASAVLAVAREPRYRLAARYRQRLLRDQTATPLQTAIWWTEYVLRHQGAVHLMTPARDLSWVQSHMLDVIALLIIGAVVAWRMATIALALAGKLARSLYGSRKSPEVNGIKKNK